MTAVPGQGAGRLHALINHRVTPWLVLALMVFLTVVATYLAFGYMMNRAESRFAMQAESLREDIARRLQVYEMMLRGGVGLFAASERVTRAEWHAYVARHEIERHYPGVQGMGYSVMLAPDEVAGHEAAVRAEGYPDYRVKPAGERNRYSAIMYLEPLADRNLRAFGFDMLSERVRREAMDRARDTGMAALSGMVTLVQEDGRDVQNGFLLYLPVYRGGRTPDTVLGRRAALLGLVYSPFRIGDFLAGLRPAERLDIDYSLYDGEFPDHGSRLHATAVDDVATPAEPFYKRMPIYFAGRAWTLDVHASRSYFRAEERLVPWLVGFGGVAIDMLVFVAFLSFHRRNTRAERLAETMTEELRQSRNHMRALLNSLPFLAWLKDAEGRYAAVNLPFARALGADDKETLVGRTDALLWPAQVALANEADHRAVMQHGRPMHVERVTERDGRPVWNEIHIAPVFDAEGTVVGSAGLALDITERKIAQQEQSRLESELRQAQKMEALGRLTGGIAHDFNNILAAILGYTHLAAQEFAQDADGKLARYLDHIRRSGERARDLVAKMLAYVRPRAESGADPIDPAPVIREGVQLLASTIPSSVRLDLRIDAPPAVRIDPLDLQQILFNLVINARDAVGPRGQVDIALGASDEAGRLCTLCHHGITGKQMVLEVCDNGPGIPLDALQRIFDPFYTTKEVGAGSGLGLSMVQGLIHKAGGHVIVRTQPGRGAVFQILLPAADAVAPDAPDVSQSA